MTRTNSFAAPIGRAGRWAGCKSREGSASRVALQRMLANWLPQLHALRGGRRGDGERILRWAVDVDPLAI